MQKVRVRFVRTGYRVIHPPDIEISIDRDIKLHRASKPDWRAGGIPYGLFFDKLYERSANGVPQFELVYLAIAPDERGYEALVCLVDKGLDELFGAGLKESADLFYGLLSRRRHPFYRQLGGRGFDARLPYLRPFDIGGVSTAGAARYGVLSAFSEHHELVGEPSAYGACLGLHGPEVQPAPLEYPRVGPVHVLVLGVQALDRGVEGVCVLHHELPAPHKPEPGPYLVPELGLYLVEVQGQVFI